MAAIPDLRSRAFWVRAGWIATFVWIVAVYEITGGDSSQPLWRFIFLVPLGGWLVGMIAGRLIFGPAKRNPPAKRGPPATPDEPPDAPGR